MADRDSPVTADELHAYVDGMLPADRMAAVEAWLASHPDDAARVAEWQLERFLFTFRYDDSATVACPRRIESSAPTRCRVRYRNGTVRPIFVRVTPVGTLEILTP